MTTMTKMSDPSVRSGRQFVRNTLEYQGGSALARTVHDSRARVSLMLTIALSITGSGGCILPPSLSADSGDAGVNSPPTITAVRTDADNLFEPGPIALTSNTGTIQFELLDTDVDDMLQVRVFIDYSIDDPTPHRTQCTAAATGSPKRTVTCAASTICQTADNGQRRNLTAVVFDRLPLEAGKPEFQAMPAGGLSTSRFFFADCAGAVR